jgi:peptidoglycan/xylan/chitin deacetylase (PgdA/CDA1 family)
VVIATLVLVSVGVLAVATGPAEVPPTQRSSVPSSAAAPPSATPGQQPAPTPTAQTAPAPAPGPPIPAWEQELQRRETGGVDRALRYTQFVSTGSPRRREIALTFDDGPSQYTKEILRILMAKRAPATFFVVGQQLNRFTPELRAELRNGFQVGDHTENHAFLGRLGRSSQLKQINDAALRVRATGAPFPRLFRPPYGSFNAGTLATIRRLRMMMVLWSVDPQDWRRPGTKAIISSVLAHARPGGIVLMHDGGGYRDQTVAALPSIIDGLRRRHLHLVSVARLILDDPPPRHQRPPRVGGG